VSQDQRNLAAVACLAKPRGDAAIEAWCRRMGAAAADSSAQNGSRVIDIDLTGRFPEARTAMQRCGTGPANGRPAPSARRTAGVRYPVAPLPALPAA
jgi:hypothetical protein